MNAKKVFRIALKRKIANIVKRPKNKWALNFGSVNLPDLSVKERGWVEGAEYTHKELNELVKRNG